MLNRLELVGWECRLDQFSLAAGVACIDDQVDVVPFHQPLKQLEAAFSPLNRLELELIRDNRKVLEAPLGGSGPVFGG